VIHSPSLEFFMTGLFTRESPVGGKNPPFSPLL
jgi:hypothetical protein